MKTGLSTHVEVVLLPVLLCHVMLGQTGSDVIPHTPSACVVSNGVGGLEATCSGDSVSNIPKTLPPHLRKLKIFNTGLAVLENGALSHLPMIITLDLSGNRLTHLKPGCFRGLPALRSLNIAHNRLCFGDDAFPEDLFTGMTSLRTMVMHSNNCPSGHIRYPDRALGKMSGLETLAMNGLPNVPLGPGFARMTSLRSLELSGKHCHLDVVSHETFASLANTSVSQLSLRACDISRLDHSALTPLSSLVTVNLACNERVGLGNAVAAIRAATATRLDTIIMDNVNAEHTLMDERMFRSARFSSVHRFSFRANEILSLDVRALKYFPAIRSVAMGYNIWTGLLPRENYVEILKTVTGNMTIDVVDASHFLSSRSKYRRLFCEPDHVDADAFFRDESRFPEVNLSRRAKPAGYRHGDGADIPLFMLAFYVDHSHYNSRRFTVPEIHISDYSDVVVINMSSTYVNELEGPFVGFNNVQVLDASNCGIYKIHSGALRQIRYLKYLFLQHNKIGEKGDGLTNQFHDLQSLIQLDLSHNQISTVDRDAFRDLERLRHLNLRGNKLTALWFDFSHLALDVSIDVSSNPVVSSKWTVAGECEMWEDRTEGTLKDVTLVCDCSNVTFIYWRQSTSVGESRSLKCVNGTDNRGSGVHDGPRLSRRVVVFSIAVIVVIIVIVAFLVVVIGCVVSRHRHTGEDVSYSPASTEVT